MGGPDLRKREFCIRKFLFYSGLNVHNKTHFIKRRLIKRRTGEVGDPAGLGGLLMLPLLVPPELPAGGVIFQILVTLCSSWLLVRLLR